ncbi:Subunit of the glycosylphosphatidylinositol transamidase complex-like protein [Cryptotrichosporon argae]
MRLASAAALICASILARAHDDTFTESLTVRPLPDGRLSVAFEFTTAFELHGNHRASHHSLTPPALLLPLERNNVSELVISFSAGKWDERTGTAGPQVYEIGGGGGEVRGWLQDGADADDRWTAVTHAIGGLFCAGLGSENGAVRTLGSVFPPRRDASYLTHYFFAHPRLHLCTENLTPFLSLLPSKGVSGLAALLSPRIFRWGYQSELISVVMPTADSPGVWKGAWEGIVDITPKRNGQRAPRQFSIQSIFGQPPPRPFLEAMSSHFRILLDDGMAVDPSPLTRHVWIDGRPTRVASWRLDELQGRDVRVAWNEDAYEHPVDKPSVSVSRTVASPRASDGTLRITIANHGLERRALYTELWPWWVKGWISELVVTDAAGVRDDIITTITYDPSLPPTPSTTTLHVGLTLPANTTLVMTIPFTKLTLKYKEHRPDAERGQEIPASILTLLDLDGDDYDDLGFDPADAVKGQTADPRRSGRTHVYANRLLLDLPTPDFSMPYNVIIMSSTVMAVFFGSLHGRLIRRWGWIQVDKGD